MVDFHRARPDTEFIQSHERKEHALTYTVPKSAFIKLEILIK